MVTKIRIVIIEDYTLFRTTLKKALDNEPTFEVVGEADKEETALKVIKESQPVVILMDAHLLGANVLDIIPKLLRWYSDIKIIIMTSHQNDPLLSQLLKLGALGALTKDVVIENAVQAIQTVNYGQRYLSPGATAQMALERLNGADKAPLELLSPRESQVMMMVIQGMNIATIAKKLNMGPKTVCSYRYRMKEKLFCRTKQQLIEKVGNSEFALKVGKLKSAKSVKRLKKILASKTINA